MSNFMFASYPLSTEEYEMKQLHLYLQLTELKQSNIKSSSLQTSYRFDAPFTQLLSAHFFNSNISHRHFYFVLPRPDFS